MSCASGTVVCVLALLVSRPATAQERLPYEDLQTFSAVLNHIRNNYIDSVSYSMLVHAAIDGVLRALDPHSYFVTRRQLIRQQALERGDLGTVGITLEEVDGLLTVLSVEPDGPADRRGVQPGDRLRAINDTTVDGLDPHVADFHLAGRRDSRVSLTLERGPRLEPERVRISLKRENVDVRSVRQAEMLDDSTGYVQLVTFHAEAGDELESAIRRLQRSRARRLVLDLRGNPGGSVHGSVQVASLFFPRNTLVFRTRGRKHDIGDSFATTRNGRFRDMALVILIDEQTASAAEAFAGSLQDHDRAIIIGRRSFGKALMQAPFPLPGGDVVWLTVGRVLTPSGRYIQRQYRGLRPEQYREFAGGAGALADTVQVYHTEGGRVVRGGGGIAPDVEVAAQLQLPVWVTEAAGRGLLEAVADSVAFAMSDHDDTLAVWIDSPGRWRAEVLEPFLGRVREELGVAGVIDGPLAERLALWLARRVAEVGWGREGAEWLSRRHDLFIRAALEAFPTLEASLASPSN